MKRLLIMILSLLLIITAPIVACAEKPDIGSFITFGGHDWRVLDIKGKTALIISEQTTERQMYQISWDNITWQDCYLRDYLNNEYYNDKFTPEEKARIVETINSNPPNPWYGTNGCEETIDKIFLLSLDEVVKYFGDSGDLKNKKRQLIGEDNSIYEAEGVMVEQHYVYVESPEGHLINDNFNEARVVKGTEGYEWTWWLRSPGKGPGYTVCVSEDGMVLVDGCHWASGLVGVRPAMWVKY